MVVSFRSLSTVEFPAPSTEERQRLVNDPFFQSFTEAFDEVLSEETPGLRLAGTFLTDPADSVSVALVSSDSAVGREQIERAIMSALDCVRLPGAKAGRSFIFARNKDGVSFCLEVGENFDMTPGEIVFTGRPLDAAVSKDCCAFFILEREGENEACYSRAGNFFADSEGELYLEKDGTRFYLQPRVTDLNEVSRLALFPNPAFLTSDDGVFFRPTEKSGEVSFVEIADRPTPLVVQGHLETSNSHLDLLLRLRKRGAEIPLVEKESTP
jgi:hypothetical protein